MSDGPTRKQRERRVDFLEKKLSGLLSKLRPKSGMLNALDAGTLAVQWEALMYEIELKGDFKVEITMILEDVFESEVRSFASDLTENQYISSADYSWNEEELSMVSVHFEEV